MRYSPILLVHILGGTLGLVSGTVAVMFRKGSRWHVLAGRVFVASMLTMGAAATYLAIIKHQNSNIGGGILTFYLVGTAWLTARRRDGETSRLILTRGNLPVSGVDSIGGRNTGSFEA